MGCKLVIFIVFANFKQTDCRHLILGLGVARDNRKFIIFAVQTVNINISAVYSDRHCAGGRRYKISFGSYRNILCSLQFAGFEINFFDAAAYLQKFIRSVKCKAVTGRDGEFYTLSHKHRRRFGSAFFRQRYLKAFFDRHARGNRVFRTQRQTIICQCSVANCVLNVADIRNQNGRFEVVIYCQGSARCRQYRLPTVIIVQACNCDFVIGDTARVYYCLFVVVLRQQANCALRIRFAVERELVARVQFRYFRELSVRGCRIY